MTYLDFYYSLKPIIPRAWQIRLRQRLVRRKIARGARQWPIHENAGRPPAGWPGWPDGAAFTLVLTHDVETARGQERCRRLMDLEEELGFRSSFNFVPEKRYAVSAELRREMVARGFEVGVHGLYHDGRDFQSRAVFDRRAARINSHLKDWQAVGFRSPSMRHNLQWIGHLDIEYDSSTFDTDPFEPQPEGVSTIFPFWVGGQKGYVELPYTLPQDFTLFVMMKEASIDIWKRKVEWIAAHGGMALLDTHPDYMCLQGAPGIEEYPIGLYREFLLHVRERYAGRYWHALPRDVARHCAKAPEHIRRRPARRVCMLAYAFYENDNRIIRYARSFAERGDEVDVISLRRDGLARHEVIDDVSVHRIQRRRRNEKGKAAYLLKLALFFARSFFFLNRKNREKHYDLVHVHSVPDFEVFATWRVKRLGTRVILDIHDIVPEFYASKFGVDERARTFRLLLGVEGLACGFADHVIIANDIWHRKLVSRSVSPERCSVFLNYVDPAVFAPHPRTRHDDRFVIFYPGGLQWHQGLDIAIRAFAKARPRMPRAEFLIHGDGSERERLLALIAELGLGGVVRIENPVPFRRMPELLANADLGVVAKRADSFGNEAYSTKILEYMSQGVPVLVSRTQIDTLYFSDDVVRFFESGNEDELARAMLDLYQDRGLRERLGVAGRRHVESNNWNIKKGDYLRLADSLMDAR